MNDSPTDVFADLAELARTLGHAHRLKLLSHIAQGERSVERLAEMCELSVANASQHLQHLRRSGYVQTRRDGKRVLYRLGEGPIANLLAALRQLADFNRSAIRELLVDSRARQDRLEAMSRLELIERLQDHSVTLLDVRPPEEFALGHLPGAINIPLAALEQRLAELPADQEIVAYCRGPWCVLSVEAVAALRERGFRARRLDTGFPDWQAAGLKVETVV
ncbi:ArsR/SmtB family transcription factor [Pseudomonas fontis]|uniref:Metalloregulator ArsR/SmtB family transcription factor n=1 Tax=Pseudomonas fontis TaxID=2942633 RepID=A0ABT5NY60_9PSED|nr:metalloregulator ArsR/SmtB family transcription factor [Pseudomonas fontis]MDD0977457.1 metalloregulator ArsR/SmtB family transcription factor [Pseudomonas fontis]MDD0993077.1 metalloregulator ArsR/SmtB family transcription factor [Pseudomonas fontis]